MPRRSGIPIWLMGMTNALFGMYGGILVISIPELLNARHVPESTISAMTAAAISPGFWSFIASPMLDVRFSRRWYAMVTAVLAAGLMTVALLDLENLALVEVLVVTGFFFGNLYQSAIGGWLSSVVAPEERQQLSVWISIANISGGGAMAVAAGELVQRLPPTAAAVAIGAVLLLPTAIFPWIEAPGPDRRLAQDSFRQFFGEVVGILRRREVLIAMALFLAPVATFSLVNLLGGVGSDFHASAHFVGLVGGGGVLLAGIAGCLVFPLIDRLLPLRFLYIAVGVVGAAFTLTLIVLPRTPLTFALALIGENVFQSLALAVATAIAFDTIGSRNPLAATTFCLIVSVMNIPNTYMLVVDGWGYSQHGVDGSYAVDAGLSLAASGVLATLLIWLSRRNASAAAAGDTRAADAR